MQTAGRSWKVQGGKRSPSRSFMFFGPWNPPTKFNHGWLLASWHNLQPFQEKKKHTSSVQTPTFLFLVDLLVSLGSAAKNTQTIPNTIAINQHPKKVAYGTPGPRMKYLNHPLTMVRVHLALGLN